MIDPLAFCDTRSSLPWISRGWAHGGYAYFTTGEIAVRLPDVGQAPRADSRDAVSLSERLNRHIDPCMAWQRWPMFEMPPLLTKRCPACNGIETASPATPYVRFASATLDVRKIRMILTLPRGEVCWGDDEVAPVAFRFRDTLPNGVEYLGHGLVMPVENVSADRCVMASDVRSERVERLRSG